MLLSKSALRDSLKQHHRYRRTVIVIDQTKDESNTRNHNRENQPSHNPSMPQVSAFPQAVLSSGALSKIDAHIVEKFNELRQRAVERDPILESECFVPVIVVASSEFSLASLAQNAALDNVSQLLGEVFGAQLDMRQIESLANANDIVIVELEQTAEAVHD
jgi:hypothetical protein